MSTSRDGNAANETLSERAGIQLVEGAELLEVGIRGDTMTFVLRRAGSKTGSANIADEDAVRFTLPRSAVDKMIGMLVQLHSGLRPGPVMGAPKGRA